MFGERRGGQPDGYHSSNCGDVMGYDGIWYGIQWEILVPKIQQIVPALHIQDVTSGTTSQASPQQLHRCWCRWRIAIFADVTPLAQWFQPCFWWFKTAFFVAYCMGLFENNLFQSPFKGIPSVWRNPHLVVSTPIFGWFETPKLDAKERSWSIARPLVLMRRRCWW